MTWEKGREVIEGLLERGHLERVPADPAEAQYLLDRASVHLETAAFGGRGPARPTGRRDPAPVQTPA